MAGEVYGVRVPVLHEVAHVVFPAFRHIDRTDFKDLMREECRREGPHSLALSHGSFPLTCLSKEFRGPIAIHLPCRKYVVLTNEDFLVHETSTVTLG